MKLKEGLKSSFLHHSLHEGTVVLWLIDGRLGNKNKSVSERIFLVVAATKAPIFSSSRLVDYHKISSPKFRCMKELFLFQKRLEPVFSHIDSMRY